MEVVYLPPSSNYSTHYGSSASYRKTQSTSKEANRILDWNYNVASSSPPSITRRGSEPPFVKSRSSSYDVDVPRTVLRRTITTTTTSSSSSSSTLYEPGSSPRQGSGGISTGTVVSTLLGVAAGAAAGAAITYNMAKPDRSRFSRHDVDEPPAFARRSTFPEPLPDRHGGRYVEIERSVEKIRYPSDYPPIVERRRHPRPEYIARYSHGGSATRSREADDIYDDTRSGRHSSRARSGTGTTTTVRTRSEAATSRRPLLIADTEHRSHAGSSSTRLSNTPPIPRSVVRRSNTYDIGADRDTYVSARSHRTGSTIRPAAPPPPPPLVSSSSYQLVTRPKAGSRVTTSTFRASSHSSPSRRNAAPSPSGTYISARNVPLPKSYLGSSMADWDDDVDSIAPSDSISCVGSRRSGRSYH